jgi:hypothetical protein
MTGAKWTGDAAQAVELLLCKHKALSSNHNTVGKKKKKREREDGCGSLAEGMAGSEITHVWLSFLVALQPHGLLHVTH